MHRSIAISGPLIATFTLIAASLAFAQAPECPAANDSSLPKAAGVYMQNGHEWIILSNPKFEKNLSWNFHSFVARPPAVSDQYLLFRNDKGTNRTHVVKPLFLVRDHPSWTVATFLFLERLRDQRLAPISGDTLTKSKREATIHAIQKEVTCVQPTSDLGTGEYVLILYPPGSLPSKRTNFFDFGLD